MVCIASLKICRVFVIVGDPVPILVGKWCHVTAILVTMGTVVDGPMLKTRLQVRPMGGKFSIRNGVVVEELQDLVVEHPSFLAGVGHVWRATFCGAVDSSWTLRSGAVTIRTGSGIRFEDPSFAFSVNFQDKLLRWNTIVEVVLDGVVHVELIHRVPDEALLPLAVEGLVDTGEVVPGAVVVVRHDVEPVDVGVDLVQVVSIVGLVRIGSSSKSEKVRWIVLFKRVSHLLHQQREVLFVQWVCGHFRQHVVSGELPVEVNPVKSKVLHEMDGALDEHGSPLPGLSHVREDPTSRSPAANRKKNLQVWILFFQRKRSSNAIVLTIFKTPFCHTTWCPNISVPFLDAVLDRLLAEVNGTHVKPGVPCTNFIGMIEDVAEAVVNHIAETYINVLWPKLTQSGSCICPYSIIASYMLLACLSISLDNLLETLI